jgi:hypothetical protein
LGSAGVGAAPDFARGYAAHKTALFEAFHALLAPLGKAFPGHTIIVRPHPGEKAEPWLESARPHPNVRVVHEGNVVPWLMAADALVHNGCTTAVEASLAGTPAIAFRPVKAFPFDLELPNGLSHEAATVEQLCEILGEVLRGERGCAPPSQLSRPLTEHLAGLSGPLASDRIVDVLQRMNANRVGPPRPALRDQVRGWIRVNRRAFVKQRIKARVPGHRNDPSFQAHRFGGLSLEELDERIVRFGRVLDRFGGVRARRISEHVFQISA